MPRKLEADSGTPTPLDDMVETLVRSTVARVLLENNYNRTRTARALGVTRQRLQRMVWVYGWGTKANVELDAGRG